MHSNFKVVAVEQGGRVPNHKLSVRCLQGKRQSHVFVLLIQDRSFRSGFFHLHLISHVWQAHGWQTVVTTIETSSFDIDLYSVPLVQFGHMLINVSFTNLSSTCNHLQMKAMYSSDKYRYRNKFQLRIWQSGQAIFLTSLWTERTRAQYWTNTVVEHNIYFQLCKLINVLPLSNLDTHKSQT